MPITVTAPRGVLTRAGEREVLPRLTDALLDASGMPGNPALAAVVGGTVQLLDPERIYAGGVNRPLVLVEATLPDIGLPTLQARAAFVAAATEVVDGCTGPAHERADTWVAIVNASGGGWGIGGRAYTGEALMAALGGSV